MTGIGVSSRRPVHVCQRQQETGCRRSDSAGECRRTPIPDIAPVLGRLSAVPRNLTFGGGFIGGSATRRRCHANDCSHWRRAVAADPNLPARSLQSSRTANHRPSGFASTKRPFVISRTRPIPGTRERQVWSPPAPGESAADAPTPRLCGASFPLLLLATHQLGAEADPIGQG
jgi:hypothetical protein